MNLFVTGTDTGIGKTLISAVFALKLGFHYWKPIQAGLETESDSEIMRNLIGENKVYKPIYSLKRSASPHQASHDENISIDLERILQQRPRCKTIIEGAGGVLVPLNEKHLMIDLIVELYCPIILVTRSTLGTINHTLLTLEALRARSIHEVAIVMVGEPCHETRIAIEKYGNVSVVGEIPFLKDTLRPSLIDACKLINMEALNWIR